MDWVKQLPVGPLWWASRRHRDGGSLCRTSWRAAVRRQFYVRGADRKRRHGDRSLAAGIAPSGTCTAAGAGDTGRCDGKEPL